MLTESMRLDLKNVAQLEFNFVLGEPFHPYQQLMGVLPAASKELVPSAFRVRNLPSNRIWEYR